MFGSKVGHQVLSLALPHCFGMSYWHHQLVLGWYLHQPESHQLSLQNMCQSVRDNKTHRSDQGHLGPIKISICFLPADQKLSPPFLFGTNCLNLKLDSFPPTSHHQVSLWSTEDLRTNSIGTRLPVNDERKYWDSSPRSQRQKSLKIFPPCLQTHSSLPSIVFAFDKSSWIWC